MAPSLDEKDPALMRRFRVIPFNVSIPEAEMDRNLDSKLAQEASGILNWLVEGARGFYAGELSSVPIAAREASDELWEGVDSFGAWLKECCTPDSSSRTESKIILKSHTEWAKDYNGFGLGRTKFYAKLRQAGYRIAESNGKTIVYGLRLKNEAEKAMMELPFDDADTETPHVELGVEKAPANRTFKVVN
jgi:putative DNA primase/helicase